MSPLPFLNSPIDKQIHVKPPAGYDMEPGKVWLLGSALYRCKQSPLLWNQHMKGTLEEISSTSIQIWSVF